MIQSSYLNDVLSPSSLKQIAAKICRKLKYRKNDFDVIAFRGMSGALIAPIVAAKMNKGMLMVRKESDKNHSNFTVEGNIAGDRFIIIDDLVCTGDTIREIVSKVQKGTSKKFVGLCLYCHEEYTEKEDIKKSKLRIQERIKLGSDYFIYNCGRKYDC